jgi:large subunit ribosomal protein L9
MHAIISYHAASRFVDKERKQAETLAAQLEKISITIKMKVGEEDKLFGSVTSQMIADALVEKEITLDKRNIELEEPLKALGIYDVPVKLAGGVIGKIKVWIVRE